MNCCFDIIIFVRVRNNVYLLAAACTRHLIIKQATKGWHRGEFCSIYLIFYFCCMARWFCHTCLMYLFKKYKLFMYTFNVADSHMDSIPVRGSSNVFWIYITIWQWLMNKFDGFSKLSHIFFIKSDRYMLRKIHGTRNVSIDYLASLIVKHWKRYFPKLA
jgi:hypothetical protein